MTLVICNGQHFSGHKFTQLFAEFHILRVTNSHWQNGFSLGYKTPQYIQIFNDADLLTGSVSFDSVPKACVKAPVIEQVCTPF